MVWQVRRARASDMEAVAEIVNEHIVSGWAHFGDRPQAGSEWVADWVAYHERYPWLVAEQDGEIGGLAYGKTFNSRAAYDWTAEVSIYLRDGLQGKGLGSSLYGRLIPALDAQGYRCLIAGITRPTIRLRAAARALRVRAPRHTRAGRLQDGCVAQRGLVAAPGGSGR